MATIDRKELLTHTTFLASDDMRGRLTGSPGQRAAAEYIARFFASLGLEPLGAEVDGKCTFLQNYGVTRTFVAPASRLDLGGLRLTDGFAVLGGRTFEVALQGKLRFCGIGRVGKDDADVPQSDNLQDAIAVVLVKHPRLESDVPLHLDQEFAKATLLLTQFNRIGMALQKRGAAAVLFVQTSDPTGLCDVLAYLAVAPGQDRLSPRFRDGPKAETTHAVPAREALPTLVLSVSASAKVLAELGVDKEAATALLEGRVTQASGKTGVDAKLSLTVARDEQATACNVVALLRGRDPDLQQQAVIYSAHMDHVGTRIDGDVYNGADDNASGSAGLLAIASAYAKSGEKPRRSVIFLSLSGEELGLWGSAFFADHPTWDAHDIVADVNMDMIARTSPECGKDEVMLTPSFRHQMFSTVVRDAAEFAAVLGFSPVSGDKYFQRSDHYTFSKKGFPVVCFCNGEHEDYHGVNDSVDKLDAGRMERLARLAFWTGWSAANTQELPHTLGPRDGWR
jgi:hypothetical protein